LLIWIKRPDKMGNPLEGGKQMGGGSTSGLTPQGVIAAGIAHNPDYGKMAADSIAKEAAERGLLPKVANGEQAAPATGTDETPHP
jgi:hypothetical protein